MLFISKFETTLQSHRGIKCLELDQIVAVFTEYYQHYSVHRSFPTQLRSPSATRLRLRLHLAASSAEVTFLQPLNSELGIIKSHTIPVPLDYSWRFPSTRASPSNIAAQGYLVLHHDYLGVSPLFLSAVPGIRTQSSRELTLKRTNIERERGEKASKYKQRVLVEIDKDIVKVLDKIKLRDSIDRLNRCYRFLAQT